MAQYDIVFAVNEASSGELFSEQKIRLGKGELLVGTDTFPVALPYPSSNEAIELIVNDSKNASGLGWMEISQILASIPEPIYLLKGGDTMYGKLFLDNTSTPSQAPLNFAHCTPNSTVNGDMWRNDTGLYVKLANTNYFLYHTGNAPTASLTLVTQAAAQAGTNTTVTSWTAQRVKQAIDALAPKTDRVDIVTVTNSNHTLILSDAGKYIRMNSTIQRSVTVPPNSSVNFPVGTVITIEQAGSGSVEVISGSGVSINSFNDGDGPAGQYAAVQLIQISTNNWTLIGAVQI